MSFKHRCDAGCLSSRCPAALERIKAGWRNGRDPLPGISCLHGWGLWEDCSWPNCMCIKEQLKMTNKIDSFRKEFDFLSNFFGCEVRYNYYTYSSLEHGYQAAKVLNLEEHDEIASAASPGLAKKIGRSFALRPDWDSVKVGIMRDLLKIKFSIPELRAKLLATGDVELIEGNNHGDTYWGVCKGKGENMLGKLLMELREKLRNG